MSSPRPSFHHRMTGRDRTVSHTACGPLLGHDAVDSQNLLARQGLATRERMATAPLRLAVQETAERSR
jgi:hypothetical protein